MEEGGYIFASDHSVPDNTSLDTYRNIVALAKEYGIYVVHDLAYADIVFDGWQAGGLRETRDLHRGIRVIFSRRGERADEVIKRLDNTVRNASKSTFGIKPLREKPLGELTLVEIMKNLPPGYHGDGCDCGH